MPYQLAELAQYLDLPLQGETIEITGVNTLQAAAPNELSFLSNPKYIHQLATTQAGAVIIKKEYADAIPRALISKDPYTDFGRLLSLFDKPQGCFNGISPQAYIHPEAIVDPTVTVYPFAFIGAHTIIKKDVSIFPGVYIGEKCFVDEGSILYPHAVIMAHTHIGKKCILHSGSVIGKEGFGFSRNAYGIQKIPQIGTVVIKDNVEIGASTAIDRGTLNATTIAENTKIDNLVQIAHNVTIGKNTFIVSQVGISGSSSVGNNCTLAGQTGVAGHITIGNNVTIGPQSGIARDVPDNNILGGSPAVDRMTYLKTLSLMPQYPNIFKRLNALEKTISLLKEKYLQE